MVDQTAGKRAAAIAALAYVPEGEVLGVGTGSTARFFIEALASMKDRIPGAVASSEDTKQRLLAVGVRVFDLNEVDGLSVYIDGADEINPEMHMIKGGGAALTREKIIGSAAKKFICIVDESKFVDVLGRFPLPIEVIPLARASVMRELARFGGKPILREGLVTDNGNLIVDIHDWQILDPVRSESDLNHIPGVVCNGIFARRPADLCLLGSTDGVRVLSIDGFSTPS